MKANFKNIYLLGLLIMLFTLASGDAYAEDVFDAIRTKAYVVVRRIGALATLIAGFGLIGFAFGAIFGKISWKWFANLAIGLFLVANVGLFIDYFATSSGAKGQYAALGYGSYLNSSSGNTYSGTAGSASDPASQTSGSGGTSGQTDSSQLASGDCVPGTGVDCGGQNSNENGGENTGNALQNGQSSEWSIAGLDATGLDAGIGQLSIDTSGVSDTLAAMEQAQADAEKSQKRKETTQKVLGGILSAVTNLNNDGKLLGFMDDSTNKGKISKNVASSALTGLLGGLTTVNNQSLSEDSMNGGQATGAVSKNVISGVLGSLSTLNKRGNLTQNMDNDTTGQKVKQEMAEGAIDGLIAALGSANQTIGQKDVDGIQLSQDAAQNTVNGLLGRLTLMNKQGDLVDNIGGDSNSAGVNLLQGATKEVISGALKGTQSLSNTGFTAIERHDAVNIDMSGGGQQDLLSGTEVKNVDVTISGPEQLQIPSL